MPALSSSPISAVLGQLSDLPADDRALLSGQCPGMTQVPDQRDPRGVLHSLTSLLLAAVTAVLAGARSFTRGRRMGGGRGPPHRSSPLSTSAIIR